LPYLPLPYWRRGKEEGAFEDEVAGGIDLDEVIGGEGGVERGAMTTLMNIMMRRKMQMES